MKPLRKYFLLLLLLFLLSGCVKNKSYVYSASTGEKIKITIATNGGYDISDDTPFIVSKNGDSLSQGTFMFSQYYDDYAEVLSKDQNVNIISQEKTNNMEYIFYSYKDTEYNYVIKINNSKTGILLLNNHSKEEAKLCFELLKFAIDD